MMAICSSVRRRSPAIGNSPRSGSQGGMWRLRVSAATPSACFFTSAYDSSANGATSPGRWHGAQLANTIGATSLVKVTGAAAAACSRAPRHPADASATVTRTRETARTRTTAGNGTLRAPMTEPTASLLVDARCTLGEGPVWDAARGVLWWTDIERAEVWRFDPATARAQRFAAPDRVGFLAVCDTGQLLLGMAKQIALAGVGEERFESITALADVERDLASTRVNEGRTDRAGNAVFGTLDERPRHPRTGSFYQYSSARGLRAVNLPHVGIANSICFSPDGGTMWFTDTTDGAIRCGRYDADAARVDEVRVFVALKGDDGGPDGSVIDADGCLWNAAWGASVVRRYTPDGRVDRIVRVPTKNPSCPAFGGDGMHMLYVTSARQMHSDEELARTPI